MFARIRVAARGQCAGAAPAEAAASRQRAAQRSRATRSRRACGLLESRRTASARAVVSCPIRLPEPLDAKRLVQWKSPAGAGLLGSRPVSRILSRVTIHLCGYPAPRRAASAEPVRLAPDGVWRAGPVARAAGGLLPHRFTLTGRDSGDPRPAVCFLCHFPSAFAASLVSSDDLGSVLPCGVRTFLDASSEAPRSPGLQRRIVPPVSGAFDPPVQAHRALGAADERPLVEDELAADRALERRSAQHGEELLLERPVE